MHGKLLRRLAGKLGNTAAGDGAGEARLVRHQPGLGERLAADLLGVLEHGLGVVSRRQSPVLVDDIDQDFGAVGGQAFGRDVRFLQLRLHFPRGLHEGARVGEAHAARTAYGDGLEHF